MEMSLEALNIVEKSFDLALRGTIALEENLIIRRLVTSRLVVCAAPAYLAGAETVLEPADIERQARNLSCREVRGPE